MTIEIYHELDGSLAVKYNGMKGEVSASVDEISISSDILNAIGNAIEYFASDNGINTIVTAGGPLSRRIRK